MPRGMYDHYAQSPVMRFWRYVDKKTPDECWNWIASKTKGYGSFITEESHYAHRFSFFLHHPYTSTDLCVRHMCDNPSCVNPHHLCSGTHADNMADMKERGRGKGFNTGKKGEATNHHKLTSQQVAEIKEKLENRKRGDVSRLAREYNISRGAIESIRTGRTWN